MRNFIQTRGTMTRLMVSVLTWALVAGQVMQPVYAQVTPLGDVPIAAKVAAKPNIVYTLDDSGSMQLNYTPDYLVSTSASITITTLTRVGLVATATGVGANSIAVGDFVSIAGASPAAYNGYFQVITKPAAGTFTYNMLAIPATSPATVAAGYANKVVLTSSAFCRSGNNTTPCAAQATAIASAGTAVAITSITRPGPIATAGPVTATATGTAINFASLTTGDTILIQNSAALPIPGTTSDPYYGIFSITVTSPTTFTYTIQAVGGTTPLAAAGGRQFVIQGGSTFAAPPMHAADFNRLAYNPNVTYTAPLKADGTPLTNTGTDANGNYGATALKYGTASVDRDPFSAAESLAGVTPMWAATVKDDLSIKIGVQLYCNTDWPLLVNDPNWPGGPNGATARDVGDANGQYQATKGAWCRINGTKYDASPLSGAPATAVAGVEMGYNYPWQSSSGVNGAQYFYRQLATKSLWCDTTSPYWPRTATIASCNGGVAVGGAVRQQTCNQNGKVCNPVAASRNYTPVACKTDPPAVYCVAGTGGSGGSTPGTGTLPECIACNCNSDTNPVNPGNCSITGAVCNAGYGVAGGNLGQCPNQPPNTITSCTGGNPVYTAAGAACGAALFDPYTNLALVPATTMLDDANGAGVVCRHNNRAYAVTGAPAAGGLFTYGRTNLGDVAPANKAGGNTPKGYPLTQTGAFTSQVTSGCPTVGTTVAIPRHYYVIDTVNFCNDRNVIADDQWKGFGTGIVGTSCQATNDLANFKDVKYGKFTRVDLFPGNTVLFPGNSTLPASTTPFPNGRVWLAGATPGPDNSESINYANWYAYYSTRLNAAKTTSAIGFSFLTSGAGDPVAYRVGFHTLGEEPSGFGGATPGKDVIFVNVNDWDLVQRNKWYAALFGIAVTTFKTPTIDAMMRIGNLFEKGSGTFTPAVPEVRPLLAATDPISLDLSGSPISCQNNYHILFTDGVTNQVSLPTTVGDQDGLTIPALPPAGILQVKPDQVLPNLCSVAQPLLCVVPKTAWPAPFIQGTAISNTLSDVATYYWARDLRPALKNDVPSQSGKGTGDIDYNPAVKDVAWWQHVNFSAISFGAQGTLDPSNQVATLDKIKAGTLSWPNLTQPNNPIYPRGAGAGAVAVDDLWHATLMARGSFVFARSPVEVSYGISNILASIQNQRKSRAGAAFNSEVLDPLNDIIFEPTIEVGWAGDLLKVQIDPVTGAEVVTLWKASDTLAAQIKPAFAGEEPWLLPARRRVVTLANAFGGGRVLGPGVPFQYVSLNLAPAGSSILKSLAPATNVTQQQKIIAYLRGGNTFNAGATVIEGTGIGQFRKRFGAMGDISNAQPVIVAPSNRLYVDATDPGYSGFVASQATRPTVVVAPANDGMVHVFDAGPMPTIANPNPGNAGGTEIFAYIPRALFRGTAGSAATEDVTAIQALTYQDGGVPIYHHHMLVDSSPRAADIDFNNGVGTPPDGSSWHTIVVGGLGKGGTSYYALDLTGDLTALVTDEVSAASRVMWEWFNPDSDVPLPGSRLVTGGYPGFTYGHPVIVKVREDPVLFPTGRWVVVVTGGYNNLSGVGKVYFLDARTGQLLSTITTSGATAGGPGTPAGLAQIHGFVRNQHDQTIEQIYGGDLFGNVWRIDVSARSNPKAAPDYLANVYNGLGAKAAPVVLFAQLTDPLGVGQPVTTAPQIEIDFNNGIDRYVFVGTGRLLHPDDLTLPATPQQQTYYAIRDGTLTTVTPNAGLLPIQPRATMVSVATLDTAAIAGGAPNGWYQDLPNNPGDPILGSQRIVVDPQSQANIASYIGTKVQDDVCQLSLPAFLYARDYTSASSLLETAPNTFAPYMALQIMDASGNLIDLGGVGLQLVGRIQVDGSMSLGALTSGEIPGTKPYDIKNPVTGPGLRWSWRLLTGE